MTLSLSKSFFFGLSPGSKLGVTLGFVFVFTLNQHFTHDLIGATHFLFFYPMVFIVTWLLGTREALLATVLSLLCILLVRFYHGEVMPFGFDEYFRIGTYLANCLLVIAIVHHGRVYELILMDRERRHRFATDSSGIGIWEFDLKTLQAKTNLMHDRCFGYHYGLRDWSHDDFLHHIFTDDRERVQKAMFSSHSGNPDLEFRIRWPDGSIHWVRVKGKIEYSFRSRPTKMYGTIVDVTEQKRAEEALHEALFYRDEFLSIASHELKTPLTSLKLQSQLFLRAAARRDKEAYAVERVNRFVTEADRQVSRLVRLVDDMLDISRIRTGKLSITTERVSFHELLVDVVERMKPQFIDNGKSAPNIEHLDMAFVYCDRMRIEQVISNLLNNAFRYGEGKPISLRLVSLENHVRLEVQDQGIGIEPKNIDRIFYRFQRAVPAKEVSGLGLGLYIAKQIVEAHKGQISVESTPGKGSIFVLELPLLQTVLVD